MNTLSADDAALLARMRRHSGGRLGPGWPCVQCGEPNGLICRVSLPIVAGFVMRAFLDHQSCDAYALCFACAKMEYTAMVIAGE